MNTTAFYDINPDYADHTMFVLPDGQTRAYEDIWELEDRLMAEIPSGSLLFILCRNAVLPIAFYLGCLRRRCVPLLLPENLTADQLTALIDTYQPAYILLPAEKVSNLPEAKAKSGLSYFSEEGTLSGDPAAWALWKTGLASPELHPDLALLLSTSGSTGSRKLVRISAKNLQSNAASIAEYLEITAEDRAITSLPMEYTYGLSVINSHLLHGAALLITEKGLLEMDFWEFFRSAGATSFAGVPYSYSLLDRVGLLDMDLPSLRVLTQAGGKLPPALQERFGTLARQKGIRFYIMYGQTEATARMSYLPSEDCLTHPGSIGIPIPGGRFAILTENGTETAAAEAEGELIYYGPNVTLGYAQKASDLALGDVNNGRLATGDLARIGEEGYFYIRGRKSRFVKISGHRTNLDELEAFLKTYAPDSHWICTGNDETILVVRVRNTTEAKDQTVRCESPSSDSGLSASADNSASNNVQDSDGDTLDSSKSDELQGEFRQIRSYLAKQAHLALSCIHVTELPGLPLTASGKIAYQELWKATYEPPITGRPD